MKRIIPVLVSITVVFQLQFTAGLLCRASAQAIEDQGYRLEAINLNDDNIELVQFTLITDCYVTVRVIDHDQTILADGDMATGTYSVYYKVKVGNAKNSVKCCMEIYRDKSKAELLCRKEIMLSLN